MAVVLELGHADAIWVFLASALGVVPTAALMGRATKELAARSGPHGLGTLYRTGFAAHQSHSINAVTDSEHMAQILAEAAAGTQTTKLLADR